MAGIITLIWPIVVLWVTIALIVAYDFIDEYKPKLRELANGPNNKVVRL